MVAIRIAREKLIDLTLRNAMLNFRHSEASIRHVRVIAQEPTLIVEYLASERSIDVIPVPPVEAIPRDEDTDTFRNALREARTVDPDWLAAEDARRAAGERRSKKDKAAERALRDRVRNQLGMPPWRVAIDPKARAEELGINPSYDLPSRAANPAAVAAFPKLQTLFFPDRLDPKLSAIYGGARTLQEDAGISALSCAVGFLEWYDSDDSGTALYAPLLLLPINMDRRVVAGEYVFSIAGRDDDETTNVALREKLRQFGLELSEYDPEAGVDAYLASVTETVRNRPRWRVRRWVTIGIFSFSGQAMWNDLDPERWPPAARPDEHELLQQIFGDVPVGELNVLAPVHDIDHPELEAQAPVLVTDADASQVSAVIDAAGGASLVIQGPPGTGKSQTITNIIANAMWQGKSILFVSEKMAALRVVKDRLDHMNLGVFCLEVHSAKASKAQVLQSIKARMDAARLGSNAGEIERARDSLRQARQRLTDYAGVMNTPAGETGLTTHDVLWGDSSRAVLPEGVPLGVMDFRFKDPFTIDRFKRAELKAAGKALDDHAAAMGAFAEPSRQPWRGVGNLNLSRFDRTNAIQAVTQWATALESLQRATRELAEMARWDALRTVADLRAAVVAIQSVPIPAPADVIEAALLPLATEEVALQSLVRWLRLLVEARRLEGVVDTTCIAARLEANGGRVASMMDEVERLGIGNITGRDLQAAYDEAQTKARDLAHAVQLVAQVLSAANREGAGAPDVRAEAVAASFLYHIHQFPYEVAHLRSPRLAQDGVLDEIVAAHALAHEAAEAATQADFGEAPTSDLAAALPTGRELREAAAILQSTGFMGRLFSGSWRHAKATWRKAFPGEPKNRTDSITRLKAAALWKEKLAQLEASANAREAIGRNWKGVATAFDQIVAVATWMRTVQKVTPFAIPGARELRRLLYEGSSEDIAAFADLAQSANELNLVGIFREAYSKKSSIHAEAKLEQERANALASALECTGACGLKPNATIRALSEALAALRNAQECRAKLQAETVALHALGPLSRDEEAARAQAVKSTLERAKVLIDTKLPRATIRWLMHAEHRARASALVDAVTRLNAALAAEQLARDQTNALLLINPSAWCGSALEDAAIDVLADKASRAANAADDLEKQIALLSTEVEATGLGLADLIAEWTKEGRRYACVAWAVEAAFFHSAAEKLMRENPALARHTGNSHEQVRARFQQLDKEILVLNRRLVASKLFQRPVPVGRRAQSVRDYTDNQMIDHQTGLTKPRIALRRLFGNAGAAIRAYKPCIMMSPLSVAQYLEPGKHHFDLLIIDEASQMRPEDALGALIRCSQAIIVGDPEQLPPSDFFVAADSRDDEEMEDAPEESILELGRRCWRPMRMLEVHYRSRHQSLIAYSNREFYENRLLVYPSPVLEDPDFGVTCTKVEDGGYEAGQGRNPIEARAIVDEAAALMRKRIDRSIGIVAVNRAQSVLIETMMDELAASDPEIQAYRQHWDETLESFFVKNLENVQGDERDIILVSTVYGRTAEGAFHQRFGPINKVYGHRRLNVLFTRAKRRLAIFTSIDPSQIVADGKQRGVRVLKEFLEYASTGTIHQGRKTSQEPDSDFERWFLSRLKAAGYEAHAQVGVAKYRIDIGIVHPDKPGNYIIGVECDGATYHSSKAARDRDRLRQNVLEQLEWRIHRVWSTDWYRDPEREFTRLIRSVERARGGDGPMASPAV